MAIPSDHDCVALSMCFLKAGDNVLLQGLLDVGIVVRKIKRQEM